MECTVPVEVRLVTEHADVGSLERTVSAALAEVGVRLWHELVDRLEAKGLAERRAHPTDRRVKLVVLTPGGARTKAEMIAGTYTPPPELLDLDRAELAALRDATAPLRSLASRRSADAGVPPGDLRHREPPASAPRSRR